MVLLTHYLKDFVYLFYPEMCGACANSLLEGEQFICLQCDYDLPRTNFHAYRDNAIEKHLEGRIRLEKAAARYFFRAKSKVQHLVHDIKYNGNRELAVYLGIQYGNELMQSGFTDNIDMIIPVPLHYSKLKKRGFNQSEEFARGLAEATGISLNAAVLKRVIANPTQTKKSRLQRWENVESIFEVTDFAALESKHVLLVDDVVTTGSTLEACSIQILKAKNTKISIATIAVAEEN